MEHRARKRFGQNFLTDNAIIRAIAATVRPQADDFLVEIGPGLGALTTELLRYPSQLVAIELDRDLIETLQKRFASYPNFHLIQADALQVDFSSLANDVDAARCKKRLRIVGNLPYNISTPLLFHLLEVVDEIQDMHFMLQKEVVLRLAASPGTSAWGRLGIMVQYFCAVESVMDVPPESFSPVPKVNSAVVRLTPHAQLPFPAVSLEVLQNVVRTAFNMRRKTLRNALNPLVDDSRLTALGIDPSLRPENLTLEQFVQISNSLCL